MLTDYIKAAMKKARYKILDDDGTFFGWVPEIEGAWGNAPTLEECLDDLESAIEDWLRISFQHRLPIPKLECNHECNTAGIIERNFEES